MRPHRPVAAARAALSVLALVLACCPPFAGAGPAAAARDKAAPAAEGVEAILPYLDEGTFLVMRIDVDRVDPAAVEQLLTRMGEAVGRTDIPERDKAGLHQALAGSIDATKGWLKDMADAGGRRVYVLMLNPADSWEGGDEPLTVVPLAEGADADRIAGLLGDGFGSRRQVAEQVGNAVVRGLPGPAGRVRAHVEAGGRPGVAAADLAAAFAAAGDAPFRIAAVPGEGARAWMKSALQVLPEVLGGGEGTPLSRDLRWAAVGLAQRPDVVANITVKAADAAKAKALAGVLVKAAAFVKEQVGGGSDGAENAKWPDAAVPKVVGDTITFAADPAEILAAAMSLAVRGQPGAPLAPPGGVAPNPDGGL